MDNTIQAIDLFKKLHLDLLALHNNAKAIEGYLRAIERLTGSKVADDERFTTMMELAQHIKSVPELRDLSKHHTEHRNVLVRVKTDIERLKSILTKELKLEQDIRITNTDVDNICGTLFNVVTHIEKHIGKL